MKRLLLVWKRTDPILLVWSAILYARLREQVACVLYPVDAASCLVQFKTEAVGKMLKAAYPGLTGPLVLLLYIQQQQQLDLTGYLVYSLHVPYNNAVLLTRDNASLLLDTRRVPWQSLQEETVVPADFDVDACMPPLTCSKTGCDNEAVGFVHDCPACEASFCSEACCSQCGCLE